MASDGRQRVLNAIIGYITEHQYPPTIREICDMTGLKSPSTVQIHISNLMRDGLLETDHEYGASRALRVPGHRFIKDDLVKDALEKQIPKKTVFIHVLQGDDCGDYMCPSCKSGSVLDAYGNKPQYCHYCGQKLDWSDE